LSDNAACLDLAVFPVRLASPENIPYKSARKNHSRVAEPKTVNRSIARWLLTAGLVAVGSFAPTGDHVRPAAADSEGIENLKKTLQEVLRARRPEEFAFIDVVTDRVANGTLPRSLVESTFNWARKKPHYKFQYFEQALRVRAKKIGMVL
jgi:hypothetical protein